MDFPPDSWYIHLMDTATGDGLVRAWDVAAGGLGKVRLWAMPAE